MKKLYKILITCIFIAVSGIANAQTIRFVKQGGIGNGSTWTLASGDFQATINASSANDQVWVAAGTYQPASGQSFRMKEGVKILGGFPSTGNPSISNRNWSTNVTNLEGNGYRVITNDFYNTNALTNASLLDGFVIKNGSLSNDSGGGIFNDNASPTILNCIFTNNTTTAIYYSGGAMFNYRSSNPIIINCIFYNNSAPGTDNIGGGAIFNYYYSSPTITNTTFYNNSSTNNSGSTISNYHYCSPNISNTIIIGNSGGIFNWGSGNAPVYKNSIIQGIGADAPNGNLDGNTITPAQLFVSTTNGDSNFLRLSNISPAKNTGNNSYYNLTNYGDKDQGFLERIYSTIDMGAYEISPIIVTQSQTNAILCNSSEDGTATVTASGITSPYTYTWSPNVGNSSTVSGLSAGIYNCTITDSNGGTVVKTFNITSPPPPNTTITESNGVLTATQATGVTYQWRTCSDNDIPGATQQTFTPTVVGNYMVYMEEPAGCGYYSNCITVTTLASNSFDIANKLKLYPNPTYNQVTIEANELTNASLQIMDINGRVLQIQNLQNTNTINIENLQTGVYLFKITSQEGTITQRVVKN